METPVTKALDRLGVPYRVFQHAEAVESLEQAAAERGQRPGQVVRSILFRVSSECEAQPAAACFVMALVAGPQQISWPALRRHLGQNRVAMATPEEVLAVTGYKIGAVSPLGLPAPVRTLADRSLLAEDELSLGSGVRGLAVILRPADLLGALPGVEMVDLKGDN
jgi:Cys-tRNA(Pro)/Cys-tRNA(Cys) deacylase